MVSLFYNFMVRWGRQTGELRGMPSLRGYYAFYLQGLLNFGTTGILGRDWSLLWGPSYALRNVQQHP